VSAMRHQEGAALVTTVIAVAIMVSLGFGMLSIVDTQTALTRTERASEAAFNLAEGALNAEAFLLGRNWPRGTAQMPAPSSAAAPCSGQTMTGTLADPPASATPSLRDQVQSLLAQTHRGAATTSQWWVTACEQGGRSAWDASLLNGAAYDPSVVASPAARPRRMWVRAEALVGGRRRAVVALVQAGQQPAYPNLAVVTGTMGADLGNTLSTLTNGPLLSGVLNILITQEPMFVGDIGLRCSLLDATALLSCVSGLFKATSMTALGPLLQSNNYVNYRSDSVLSGDQLAQLRQQAQDSGTYYGTTGAGAGTVAANAACLPAGAAGKIVFIEQVGDGTGSCILNTTSTPAAAALIVGAGGVKVQGGTTFTGVIHTLRRKALAGDAADIRIEGGSHVVGGAYADDNAALGAKAHGQVYAVPPPVTLSASSPLCHLPLVGLICGTVDALVNVLGLGAVLGQILPQLGTSMPAVTYDANVVRAVSTFGDSALVTGTFRQVSPSL
jgi:hypothetical protein